MDDTMKAELAKPLSSAKVLTRSQAGRQLSYIEGWQVIAEANRIFGFDGWNRETVEMREVRPPAEVNGTWRVGFMGRVRVTVGNVVREGTGFGSGASKSLEDAYESAVKESETDATKRALMTFGWPFGLALYDKERTNVVDEPLAEDRIAGELINMISQAKSLAELDQVKAHPTFKTQWKALGEDGQKRVGAAGTRQHDQLLKIEPKRMAG